MPRSQVCKNEGVCSLKIFGQPVVMHARLSAGCRYKKFQPLRPSRIIWDRATSLHHNKTLTFIFYIYFCPCPSIYWIERWTLKRCMWRYSSRLAPMLVCVILLRKGSETWNMWRGRPSCCCSSFPRSRYVYSVYRHFRTPCVSSRNTPHFTTCPRSK